MYVYGRKVTGMIDSPRRRNARGSGALLREEILAAATALLDASETESDLTLRGIACAAGITAPSIYAHFPDRDAILAAVVDRAWQDVVGEIREVAASGTDPRDRLHRGCAAYVAFAQRHPLRYAMMTRTSAVTPASREALGVVTRALANCRVSPEAPGPAELPRIAAALSAALHGVAMLNRTDEPSMWLSDVSPADVITTLVDGAVGQLRQCEESP